MVAAVQQVALDLGGHGAGRLHRDARRGRAGRRPSSAPPPAGTATAPLDLKVNYLRPGLPRRRGPHRPGARSCTGAARSRSPRPELTNAEGKPRRARDRLVDVPARAARRAWPASSSSARAPATPRTSPGRRIGAMGLFDFLSARTRRRCPTRARLSSSGGAGLGDPRSSRASRWATSGWTSADRGAEQLGDRPEQGRRRGRADEPDDRPARHRRAGGDREGAARARDRPRQGGPDDRREHRARPARRRSSGALGRVRASTSRTPAASAAASHRRRRTRSP